MLARARGRIVVIVSQGTPFAGLPLSVVFIYF